MSTTSVTKAQMRCPRCHLGDHTAVLNTRHRADRSIRRRHACLACGIRWTSLEELVLGSICAAPAPASLDAARCCRKAARLRGSGGPA